MAIPPIGRRVRQKKTGRPVRFELTEQTRQAVDGYIRATSKKPGEFLFTASRGRGRMTTRQYARLLSEWIARADCSTVPKVVIGSLSDRPESDS